MGKNCEKCKRNWQLGAFNQIFYSQTMTYLSTSIKPKVFPKETTCWEQCWEGKITKVLEKQILDGGKPVSLVLMFSNRLSSRSDRATLRETEKKIHT